MKKGLTTVELCVVTVIILVLLAMVFSFMSTCESGREMDYTFINPQLETAIQQRKIAGELKRQNDLMEERMNQQKAEYENRNPP